MQPFPYSTSVIIPPPLNESTMSSDHFNVSRDETELPPFQQRFDKLKPSRYIYLQNDNVNINTLCLLLFLSQGVIAIL